VGQKRGCVFDTIKLEELDDSSFILMSKNSNEKAEQSLEKENKEFLEEEKDEDKPQFSELRVI